MKHYGAVDDPKDITTKEYVDAADNALKVKVDACGTSFARTSRATPSRSHSTIWRG